MSSSDFLYLMGSSLLDSVVFDKPSCNARSDIETADPILECLTKSSCNYYTTDDFLFCPLLVLVVILMYLV